MRRARVSQKGKACGVGPDAVDPVAARGGLQEGGEALVVEANTHRDLGRLAGGGLGQPDDGDPARRGALEQLRDPRLPGVPRRRAALRLRRRRVAARARARFGRGSRRDADWRRRGRRRTGRLRAGLRWWSGRGRGAARSSTPTRGGRLGGWIASILRSSGAWKAASSHSSERARARVPAGGPVRARMPSWRSGTTTGAPGSQAVRRTTCSAASSSSGSCSTRGPPAVSRRALAARGTGPRPTRTVRKSASAGRRSQRRSVWSTMAQSAGGPGWRCSATASWVAARWSAWDATCSRWAR